MYCISLSAIHIIIKAKHIFNFFCLLIHIASIFLSLTILFDLFIIDILTKYIINLNEQEVSWILGLRSLQLQLRPASFIIRGVQKGGWGAKCNNPRAFGGWLWVIPPYAFDLNFQKYLPPWLNSSARACNICIPLFWVKNTTNKLVSKFQSFDIVF